MEMACTKNVLQRPCTDSKQSDLHCSVASVGLCRPPSFSSVSHSGSVGRLFLGQVALGPSEHPVSAKGGGWTGSGPSSQQGRCSSPSVLTETPHRTCRPGLEAFILLHLAEVWWSETGSGSVPDGLQESGHFISASVLQKCFLSVDFTEEAEEGTGRTLCTGSYRNRYCFGGFLDCPSWSGPTLSRLLRAAGVSTLGQVVELAGPRLDDPVGLAAQLGLRSTRIMGQILKHWRQKLTAEQFLLLNDFCYGSLQQNCEDPFPPIRLFPDFKNCSGPLLEPADSVGVSLEDASGKTLYRLVVKTLNRSKLNDLH
ncbi:hypothetical protein L3Q82_002309 [Scortum barcoo]|uniref:Uncharacterized protein n=1 Tax=Scortum barcoo TaxID=214431 RepID=A0ACB8VYA0_9TELE|nr:hypothetical protein L3Q82_002309 [Scortum barcoo]